MKKRKALSLTVTVLTVAVCAALRAGVLTLYVSGLRSRTEIGSAAAPIFTREAVGRQWLWAGPLLGLWLVAVIAAWVNNGKQNEKPARVRLPAAWLPMRTIQENPKRNAVRGVLFAAAVLFIVLGVLNGGLHDVLVKAINICTECIGLG